MDLHIFAAKSNPSQTPFPSPTKAPSCSFLYSFAHLQYVILIYLYLSAPCPCAGLPITQLWNVLLRRSVELLHLSVMFGSYRWLLVLLPVCQAFEPAEGSYPVRKLRSRDPSHRDRDAKCNSTPHFLVDFIVPRVLAPVFGPRTWSRWIRYRYRYQCGYHPLTSSLSRLSLWEMT